MAGKGEDLSGNYQVLNLANEKLILEISAKSLDTKSLMWDSAKTEEKPSGNIKVA